MHFVDRAKKVFSRMVRFSFNLVSLWHFEGPRRRLDVG